MRPTRSSDRRNPRSHGWLRALPIAIGLCSLALVAPASSLGAKSSVSVSVSADPSCALVQVSGAWRAAPGQSYVSVELSENQGGTTYSSALVPVGSTATSEVVDIGGTFSPLAHGKHVVRATFTVYDAALNPVVSGKANGNMPCALETVVLPT